MEREHIRLKAIIKEELGVDIDDESRKRALVEARYIYSKILKDEGWSLVGIAKTIHKHHTSVIHYLEQCDYLLLNMPDLRDRYFCVLSKFNGSVEGETPKLTYRQITDEILRLESKLVEMRKFKKWYETRFESHPEVHDADRP
jgi:hypothetical protein